MAWGCWEQAEVLGEQRAGQYGREHHPWVHVADQRLSLSLPAVRPLPAFLSLPPSGLISMSLFVGLRFIDLPGQKEAGWTVPTAT